MIGGMRHRVSIQSRTVEADSYGAPVPAWATEAVRWGEAVPLSGRELWQAAQVRPDVTHKVTLRYYPGLTPRHRLLVEGRTFEIGSVINPDGRGRFHECLCKEEV